MRSVLLVLLVCSALGRGLPTCRLGERAATPSRATPAAPSARGGGPVAQALDAGRLRDPARPVGARVDAAIDAGGLSPNDAGVPPETATDGAAPRDGAPRAGVDAGRGAGRVPAGATVYIVPGMAPATIVVERGGMLVIQTVPDAGPAPPAAPPREPAEALDAAAPDALVADEVADGGDAAAPPPAGAAIPVPVPVPVAVPVPVPSAPAVVAPPGAVPVIPPLPSPTFPVGGAPPIEVGGPFPVGGAPVPVPGGVFPPPSPPVPVTAAPFPVFSPPFP